MQQSFEKTLLPGTVADYRRRCPVFVEVNFNGKRLSITGVIGPKRNGDCIGSAGQINDTLRETRTFEPSEQWTKELLEKLLNVWDEYHLNDMQPGTPAQMEVLKRREDEYETWRLNPAIKEQYRHPSYYDWAKFVLAQENLLYDDGYKYGSAWLTKEVPDDVLDFLRNLPAVDPYRNPWNK